MCCETLERWISYWVVICDSETLFLPSLTRFSSAVGTRTNHVTSLSIYNDGISCGDGGHFTHIGCTMLVLLLLHPFHHCQLRSFHPPRDKCKLSLKITTNIVVSLFVPDLKLRCPHYVWGNTSVCVAGILESQACVQLHHTSPFYLFA